MTTFGKVLRRARNASKHPETNKRLTQERMAELLGEVTGLHHERESISQWERDVHRIHNADRQLLVSIIRVLHDCGGITSLEEANALLSAGVYMALDEQELRNVNPEWKMPTVNNFLFPAQNQQKAELPAIRQPFADPANFVAKLGAAFAAENQPAVICLIGVAGCGKSVLSVAVAHHVIDLERFEQVIRVVLNPTDTEPIAALIELLARRIAPHDTSSLRNQAAIVQKHLRQHALCVIIDGLEVVSDALCEQLLGWARPSCFLVTGRIRPKAATIPIEEIPTWDMDAATQFVRTVMQQRQIKASTVDEHLLRQLCETVGNNPKALLMIPELARRRAPAQLLVALQKSAKLRSLQTDMMGSAWETLDESARTLLITLSFVTELGSSYEMLEQVSGLVDFPEALEAVEQYAFVTMHAKKVGWYHTQRLVADYVIGLKEPQAVTVGVAMLRYWRGRLAHHPPQDWHLLTHDQPNVFHAVRVALRIADDPRLHEPLIELLPILFTFAKRRGYTRELQPLLEQAAKLPLALPARGHLQLLWGAVQSRNYAWLPAIETLKVGLVLAVEAEDVAREALAQWELASAYKGLREWTSAENHAKIALALYQQLDDQQGIGRTLNLLGLIQHEQRAYDAAAPLLKNAIDKLEKSERANALNSYAGVLQQKGHYRDAQSAYAEAKQLYKQFGTLQDETKVAVAEAILIGRQGDLTLAESLFAQIDVKTISSVRLQGFFWSNRAQIAKRQERWQDAHTYWQQGMAAWATIGDKSRIAQNRKWIAQMFAEHPHIKFS